MSGRLLTVVSACLMSFFAPACTAPGGARLKSGGPPGGSPAQAVEWSASPPPAEDGLRWELRIGHQYSLFTVPYGKADRRSGRLRWIALYSFADGFGGRVKPVPRGEANVDTFRQCDLLYFGTDRGLISTRHGELLGFRVLADTPVPAGAELNEEILREARILRDYRKKSPPPVIRQGPQKTSLKNAVDLTVVRTLSFNAWSGKSFDGRRPILFDPSGNECTVEISDHPVCRFQAPGAEPVFRSDWIDPFDAPFDPDDWGDNDGTPDFWKLFLRDKQLFLYNGHGILVQPDGTLLEVQADPKAVTRLRKKDNKAYSRYARVHMKWLTR